MIGAKENIGIALDAVWTHRFRSLLTVLGIVIGITTVVTVSSLLSGLRMGIVDFFQEFGPDNVFISRISGDPNGAPRQSEAKRRAIRPEYIEGLRRVTPSVEQYGLQLLIPSFVGMQPLVARVPGFESDRVGLGASSANMFEIQPKDFQAGRAFTEEEDVRGLKVGVIGPSLAEALFPGTNPLGKTVNVGGAEYTVIGVTAPAKGGFFGENALDYQMTIPLSTARRRYPQLENFLITAKARPGMRDQAFDEVRYGLRRLRGLAEGQADDFNVSTADQIIKNFDNITNMIVLVSVALSALGLLVGGIGVMNIMLVSVTERTREIGLRKALGARPNDIVFQFLTEAVALTGAGGMLGIVLSMLVTLLIGLVAPALRSQVPPLAVAAGFLVSVGVGIFFGVWPALKASRLDPVEALRYE